MKKTKKPQRTSCIYIKDIPANLKSYFKAYCAKKEMTMSTVIMDYMREVTKTSRQLDGEVDKETRKNRSLI